MKEVLLACLVCLAPLPREGEKAKSVVVGKDQFSAIYPAVWFSPSTGELSPLKKKSEVPPEGKYEVWIEPRDPEFAFGPGTKAEGVGFALLGKGPDVFRNARRPKAPRLVPRLTDLMKETPARDQPVFYCKAKRSECVILITALDSKKEIIHFKWRPLSKAGR